jgi:hypothetical protein
MNTTTTTDAVKLAEMYIATTLAAQYVPTANVGNVH